ncbi:hypothetical protein [Hymenobacter cheonanensis]|uniref:hypothetical protein n=1 Tax=Hymenobacter sp. CA2-7 TaxID=3063993 RepID=UPI0027143183|nr:hypothetical protein [Hymenobacter sp. CA2-7]MDO7886540.1 hypothetical protein [Hymenobacter sp. CA2-7]
MSNAQFIPGAYILMDNPQKVYAGDLKYDKSTLTVKDKSGKKITYKTDEVYYAKTANNQRYISTSGFEALSTFSSQVMGNTLVELVDSGRICLMRYGYIVSGGSGGGTSHFMYLLKQEGMPNAVTVPGYVWTNQGKKFYEAITPYAANRPDLQKLLADHRINDRNLIAFFHAINSGQPFPALELRGKEATPKKAVKEIKERPVEDPFGN